MAASGRCLWAGKCWSGQATSSCDSLTPLRAAGCFPRHVPTALQQQWQLRPWARSPGCSRGPELPGGGGSPRPTSCAAFPAAPAAGPGLERRCRCRTGNPCSCSGARACPAGAAAQGPTQLCQVFCPILNLAEHPARDFHTKMSNTALNYQKVERKLFSITLRIL